MNSMSWASIKEHRSKAILLSFCSALTLELLILWGLGTDFFPHPTDSVAHHSDTETQYLEAEIVQLPEQARLVEDQPLKQSPSQPKITLSQIPGRGKQAEPGQSPLEEENQTERGDSFTEDHGPIAIHAPRPIIPSYLEGDEFKTYVVIDFYVSTDGLPHPRLVATSENQELDAIALETAEKWRFKPAEKNKKPVAARVRLRILFAVE